MAFLHCGNHHKSNSIQGYSADFLHRGACQVCPLNLAPGNKHPHMEPSGSKRPLVYLLGEAPGAEEDERGTPFVGKAGQTLRFRLPDNVKMRFNNVVRTRPPQNRDPSDIEIECCRPSIIADIEATKPMAIFGFGNVALKWALRKSRITNWAGRRIPIKIGNHSCWFFPMLHPSYVMRGRKWEPKSQDDYGGSEHEFKFALDLRNAFSYLTYPNEPDEPIIHTTEQALSSLEWVQGNNSHDLDRVVKFLEYASRQKLVGIDYETNGLRPYREDATILTIAVATKRSTLAFPMHHKRAQWTDDQLGSLETAWSKFLNEARCLKVSHHLPFEMEWSAHIYGDACLRAGLWGDSESQAYILDERRGMHSLDTLCLQYFGLDLKAISNLDTKNLKDAPLDDVLQYNALDAKYHRLLYLAQNQELKRQELVGVYEEQLRRVPTMVLTQLKGIPIDQTTVRKFRRHYIKQLNEIEERIDNSSEGIKFFKLIGHHYRPGAPADVTKMVRRILNVSDIENVNEKTLLGISKPIVKTTLQWRKANKLLSTYVNPVCRGSPYLYDDGLVHPVISLTQTRTWRTSTEDINIQNWPKRQTKEVREQIKPGPGYKVVSFDYGQIQARNVAMESLDKSLIKAFWERYDIHKDWMDRIRKAYPSWMGEDADEKEFRHRAKNEFVFPSFFGAQPKSLAEYLKIPQEVVAKLHKQFWKMFPHIKDWHERIMADYKELGYVTGKSGFRRRAPITMNELINAPIQADEAIIVCDAMTRLSQLEDGNWFFQANMEIHDDLVFIWPTELVDELSEVVIKEMLSVPFKWAHVVPIVVGMAVGDHWGDLKEVGVYASDTWNKDDPYTGTWADGTGWANHDKQENATKNRRRWPDE